MTNFFTKLASTFTFLALVASFVPAAVFAEEAPAEVIEAAPEITSNLDTTPAIEEPVIEIETPVEEEESTGGIVDGVVDAPTLSVASTMEPSAISIVRSVTGGDIVELQSVIDSANAGDTIQISGTYTGNLVVSKGVILKSANGPASATIVGSVTVTAAGASIEGLTITNPGASFGIVINGVSNVSITGNIITDIGTTLTEGSAQGVYLQVGSATISNVVISGNTIVHIGNSGLKAASGGTSAKGIYVGDSNNTGTVSGLVVSDNTITDIRASNASWTGSTLAEKQGRGAYGFLVNLGGSAGSTEVAVTNNTISGLAGLWAHAIGLEANTPSASVSGNTVSGLSDNKGGKDSHVIFFESNPSKNTVEIEGQVAVSLSEVVVDDSWAGFGGNPIVTVGANSYMYGVNAFSTIRDAISAVSVGGTVSVLPGSYDLIKDDTTVVSGQTGWYLALTKDNVTLKGVDTNGNDITDASAAAANIYSTQETVNGAWSTQNLITVFGNNVTIQGLVVMNKLSPNKGIEVLGDGFVAKYNRFAPIPTSILPTAANYADPDGSTGNDISKYGSGVYFNNNGTTAARTGTVTDNIFQNSGVTFDSFGSNWTMQISRNVFDGNKSWTDGTGTYYYSAIGATTWATPAALDFAGSSITVTGNQFVNMLADQMIIKVSRTGMTGTFTASKNWWGTTVESEIQALVSADHVIYTPWYVDSSMTRLNTDPAPSTGGNGGGGRSGGSSSANAGTAGAVDGGATGEGQVLGASTYNFSANLTVGATGADVNALQQMLIDAGLLKIAAPTGFFGPMTTEALKAWQAAHGVPATGFFGPLTMAAIAAATPAPMMTDEARAALIKDLLEKVKEIQEKLDAMNSAA